MRIGKIVHSNRGVDVGFIDLPSQNLDRGVIHIAKVVPGDIKRNHVLADIGFQSVHIGRLGLIEGFLHRWLIIHVQREKK